MAHCTQDFQSLGIAILTVSDTRNFNNDTSGQLLQDESEAAGHKIVARSMVKDDVYQIRSVVSAWIVDASVNVILVTGGTGFSGRDSTPEALKPLFDKEIEGFGELFRQISYQEIGTSTIQSRAIAGLANHTAIFAMPGSTNACRTGWTGIISQQLNASHKPCNFVGHLLAKPESDAVQTCQTRN